MLFKSRYKPRIVDRLRQLLWPRSGWKRAFTYISHRVARLPGTPYSIAAGFACGAAISFTPFIGLHFVLGGLLAWLMRANILASAIGTAVGNPWTFPFIWWWIYTVGAWIVGIEPRSKITIQFHLDTFSTDAMVLLLPMLLGGILSAVFVWFAFYFPLYFLVDRYQRARRALRAKKAQRSKQSVAPSTGVESTT